MRILFICRANAIRSQIAEAFCNEYFGNISSSAGIELANSIQKESKNVPKFVIDIMSDKYNIDVSKYKRKIISRIMLNEIDIIVVFTKNNLPEYVKDFKMIFDWSDIPDIAHADKEIILKNINIIKDRVKNITCKYRT